MAADEDDDSSTENRKDDKCNKIKMDLCSVMYQVRKFSSLLFEIRIIKCNEGDRIFT